MNWKVLAPIAASIVVSLSACHHTTHVVVRHRPPVERVEVQTASPGPNHFWVKGHWHHNGNDYEWVAGHWEAQRASHVYRAGHWEESDGGWVWIEGGWYER